VDGCEDVLVLVGGAPYSARVAPGASGDPAALTVVLIEDVLRAGVARLRCGDAVSGRDTNQAG
jgi:hypothetical protein